MIVIVLVLLALFHHGLSFDCTTFDSNMGAHFDITELQRTSGQPSYKIEDGDIPCTPGVESNYTYSFNVCGAITGYMEQACAHELGDKLRTAGAVQVNKRDTVSEDDDWCYVVGYNNEEQTKVELLHSNDPTDGLRLSYKGDYCNGGKQRKFNIELSCADKLNPIPTHAYELTDCEYTVYMPSVYGCPLECPVANRALCAGQGHCAYDSDKKAARCYCNRGYSGVDCTEEGSSSSGSNSSPALTWLIVTLFIIIALLVMGVLMMIKQVSAYRDDIANYQVLKGGDEDASGASTPNRRGGTSGDSFMETLTDVFSPITDMASGAMGSATAYLGSRGAARNASANAMALQGGMGGSMNSPATRGGHGIDGDVSSVTL